MDRLKTVLSYIFGKRTNSELSTKKISDTILKNETKERLKSGEQVQVLISHENYPYSKLSMETMRVLMDSLVFRISNSTDNQNPVFEGADICEDDGCIRIRCANEFSKTWLENELRMTSALLKHPVPIRLIDAQQTFLRLSMDSSSVLDSLEILTMLSKQNPTLNTEGWRVMAKYILPLSGHNSCQIHLLLEMDEVSKQQVRNLNYKAYAGFSQVHFVVVDKTQNDNVIEEFRAQKRRILPADRPVRLQIAY